MFVSNDELKAQIPNEILPEYLGGSFKVNHKSWLAECNKLVLNNFSTCSYYYYEDENITTKTDESSEIIKDLNYSMTGSTDNEIVANRKRQILNQDDVETKKQILGIDSFPEPLPFDCEL